MMTEGSELEREPADQDMKKTLRWAVTLVSVAGNMSVKGLTRTRHICWTGKCSMSSKIDERRSEENAAEKAPVQR